MMGIATSVEKEPIRRRDGARSPSSAAALVIEPEMTTAAQLGPGTVVAGKYRVEHVLGEGGMGVVVEATHILLGQRFALKLLHGDLSNVPGVCDRFLEEARIAACLPGEHVARAVDFGRTEAGLPYLVMELLQGHDLGVELGARGRLPICEAIDYVLQACEGVAELHALGIVHRDLKPENLFLTWHRDGTPLVKVLDFGIAVSGCRAPTSRAAAASARPQRQRCCSSSCGTPTYMAPEQIDPAAAIDARCDQHALAVVLYELIAGKPPIHGGSVQAILANVSTRDAAPLSEVMPEALPALSAALSRALARQPIDRFADLASFAWALAPYGGDRAFSSARNLVAILAGTVPVLAIDAPDRSLVPTQPLRPPLRSRAWHRAIRDVATACIACASVVGVGLWLGVATPDARSEQPLVVAAATPRRPHAASSTAAADAQQPAASSQARSKEPLPGSTGSAVEARR